MKNIITLFSDHTILPGTHATLVSLMQHNINSTPIHIILFADKLSSEHKGNLYKTFKLHKRPHQSFEIKDAPTTYIEGANTLHGNTTTYGRLFLVRSSP